MPEVFPFPFATLDELKARWPDFPAGGDAHATVLLEDASQFILDTVPAAADATLATRRRIVCEVVKRSMSAADSDMSGMTNMSESAGGVSRTWTPANPSGDFYLTKAQKLALTGRQKAYGVSIAGSEVSPHLPWCNLNFGANYCSCGVDIAGTPIFEVG